MAAKILIVDDERDTLLLLGKTLQFAGYEVATAENGRKALALVPEFNPDVILLDMMMMDLSGLEVLNRLRKQEVNPPPVIILSAAGRADEIEEGLQAGAYKYLVKPTPRDKLLETIKSALDYGSRTKRK
jgi:two-component system OmpR family response regulator